MNSQRRLHQSLFGVLEALSCLSFKFDEHFDILSKGTDEIYYAAVTYYSIFDSTSMDTPLLEYLKSIPIQLAPFKFNSRRPNKSRRTLYKNLIIKLCSDLIALKLDVKHAYILQNENGLSFAGNKQFTDNIKDAEWLFTPANIQNCIQHIATFYKGNLELVKLNNTDTEEFLFWNDDYNYIQSPKDIIIKWAMDLGYTMFFWQANDLKFYSSKMFTG